MRRSRLAETSILLLVGTPPGAAGQTAPTFTRDVAPIVQERCQGCHRPDGVAPFALLTHEHFAARLPRVRRAVAARRMPPWHAAGDFGVFANDRRLRPAERSLLLDWIDAGAPEGDPEHLPAPPDFTEGWRIGEPDLVFEIPETVEVPAEGVVPYQYFRVPTGLAEDTWVEAVEVVPGNRRVVHHIIVNVVRGRAGFMTGPSEDPRTAGSLGSYVPGGEPRIYEPGTGRRIPAGAELVFQLHYTPDGRPQRDRSKIGLVLSREAPRFAVRTGLVADPFIWIPAGEARHEMQAEQVMERDVYLLSMTPHMHLRGKSFEYRARFPDGREKLLLRVPDYDFDWQTTYRLAEPLLLPAGTRVECTAVYDNSAANPRNPDPTRNVSWGEQTENEMMIGFYEYRLAQPEEL